MPVDEPGDFVTVASSGLRSAVELRSPQTGRTVRVLARFARGFTNNGLALSPDGRDVYVTLIPHGRQSGRGLRLTRIDTRTGARRFIARGEQPALSGDGRGLAYATGATAGRRAGRSCIGATTPGCLIVVRVPARGRLTAPVAW